MRWRLNRADVTVWSINPRLIRVVAAAVVGDGAFVVADLLGPERWGGCRQGPDGGPAAGTVGCSLRPRAVQGRPAGGGLQLISHLLTMATKTSASASVINRHIVAFNGSLPGAAPPAGTGPPAPAAGHPSPSPRSPYTPHPRQDRRRGQHRRDRTIPALPRPAIRHRPEQFEQIIADFGDRRRRGRRSRAAISNRNGRLDHDEAPEAIRIYKTSCHTEASSCFPQLRRTSQVSRPSRGETQPCQR
jgi:hypothetical protein